MTLALEARASSISAGTARRSATDRALLSFHFDDAPARQPRASPSPPPPGGIALGGASAANSRTGHRELYEKEELMNDVGGVVNPVSEENRVHIFDTPLRDGEQSPGISLNTQEK